jgi:proprotein convertase subtilisin/kexin type 5
VTCKTTSNRVSVTNCACKPHYYETGSACAVCDYKCGNCENNKNECLTCSHSTRSAAPNCLCKDTYYNSGTDVACKPCVYPCKNCTSASVCLTCETTLNRVSVTNCSCKPHYYDTGSDCAICNYKCGNCQDNANNCTSCSHTTRS